MLAFLNGDDNDDRSFLRAFLVAGFSLAMPQIDIGEDVSWPRDRP
jgi:hypothetical protein